MSTLTMLALMPQWLHGRRQPCSKSEETGLSSDRQPEDPTFIVACLTIVLSLVQMHNRGVRQLLVEHVCRSRSIDNCSELFNKPVIA